jgi:signal transduction histidine kinase
MTASGTEQLGREQAGAGRARLDPGDPVCVELFATVLDSAAAAIAVVAGPDLRFELVNAAYRALTPRPDLDPVGRRYEEVWPADGPVALPALRRMRDTGEPCHSEDHVFADAGGVRRFSFHVKAIPWRGCDALLVVLWETTALWQARREAEEAAERAVRRASELEAILEALPDALVLYGRRGEILRMNAAAERLFGLAPGDERLPLAARWGRFRLFGDLNRPLALEELPVSRALRGEMVRGAHLRVEGPTGNGWILASAAPIRGPDGSVWGAVLTFSDESDLHDLETARDDLVRMVSHDLRTPLNAILSQAHLLRVEPGEPVRVRERARSIARSCDRMRSMIQDLLEATLLEAGQLRMAPAELDLAAFTRDVVERHHGALPVERVRVEAACPVSAFGDAERLERILVNLLSNALKYSSPAGEVTVRVERAEGGASLTVADRGVGIAPEDLPHVFERFFRARATRQPEGLGLGLYITRLLVYAHGGRIDVQSQLGCGSTFRVLLPDARPLPTPPPTP